MVTRLIEIFDNPIPPKTISEEQFDNAQEELIKTARKVWHEIDQEDYWHYLMDLKYVDLQQDLFDYLFPAFLIRWWEGLLNGSGGPDSETDFYAAVDGGNIFTQMMSESRRQKVFEWMTDAYLESVDSYSDQAVLEQKAVGSNTLEWPLGAFNAIGQSVPITKSILTKLADVSNIGRAQWWLVLASGIIWKNGLCPHMPGCNSSDKFSGISINYTLASIYDHGYREENLRAITNFVTYELLLAMLKESLQVLTNTPFEEWSQRVLEKASAEPELIASRIDHVLSFYALPELGGCDVTI
jgi:hypothetical protein